MAFIIPCFQTMTITSVIKHVVTNITVVIASPVDHAKWSELTCHASNIISKHSGKEVYHKHDPSCLYP